MAENNQPRNRRDPRHPDKVAEDRVTLARLYVRGWTQARIGRELGLSQAQVSKDLAAVRREWQRERVAYIDEAVDRELARLDAIEAEAWRGWRRSLKAAEKRYAKRVTDDGVLREETSKSEQGQSGDPRFLEVIQGCVDRRCKLVGAYVDGKEPDADQPPEVVVRVLGPGTSMSELCGGRALPARGTVPPPASPN